MDKSASTTIAENPLQFKLVEFNKRRQMRGADAARVEIIDGDDTYWLWMNQRDLRGNIRLHGKHPELEKALRAYNGEAVA